MKPVARDQLFGIYRGDYVMVVGVPADGSPNGMCLIEYYQPTSQEYGKRKTVRWGDVTGVEIRS